MRALLRSIAMFALVAPVATAWGQAPTPGQNTQWLVDSTGIGKIFVLSTYKNGLPVFAPSLLGDNGSSPTYNGMQLPKTGSAGAQPDGCAQFANNVLSSTGVACGSGSGSSITLQTNGANNAVQTILNLKFSGGATGSSDGAGGVTIAADAAGAAAAEATLRIAGDALLIPLTQRAAASGVATLDGTIRVPAAQLPVSLFTETRMRMFGVCSGSTAHAAAYSTPNSAAVAFGCVDPLANGPLGFAKFLPAQTAEQFVTDDFVAPVNFTSAGLAITFYSDSATGSVTFSAVAACPAIGGSPATLTYGTVQSVTTAVSGTVGNWVTATFASPFAVAGTNGCGAGVPVIYKVSRSITDTNGAAGGSIFAVYGLLSVGRSS